MSTKHPGRPRREEWPKCKAEGCGRTTKGGSLGFCHAHYIAHRRGYLRADGVWVNEVGRRKNYGPHDACKVPRCSRQAESLNFCNRHYQQFREGILDEQGNQIRALMTRRPRKERWVGRDGYVLVQAPPGHPHARVDGSILEHRLVMEQFLGCYLDPDEYLVHHKFGNRADNVPEKLVVLSARAKRGEGHPPGSEIPPQIPVQMLLQHEGIPEKLRSCLQSYQTPPASSIVI